MDGVLDQIKTFIDRRHFDERRLRHKVTNANTSPAVYELFLVKFCLSIFVSWMLLTLASRLYTERSSYRNLHCGENVFSVVNG